ncbi:MAG: sensor histidine kinase, partial [Verrucomicrobia bacterium]|nr:sensor histidine kinase [Verrucomicrobiota bacterium]
TNGCTKYIGTLHDITDWKQLQTQLVEAIEMEQRRIGHDLHDGLCQHLTFIEFRLHALREKLADERKAESAELAKLIRQAIEQTRTLARGLSPVVLAADGLMHALQELAARTEQTLHVSCTFRCPASVLIHNNIVATHLYRIAQEAVHNAIRHGQPKRIEIELRQAEGRALVGVRDDGIGFTPPPSGHRGMGLRIMHYRAALVSGTLAVQREAAGGTSVVCSLVTDGGPAAG